MNRQKDIWLHVFMVLWALNCAPRCFGAGLLQDLLVKYTEYGLPLPSSTAKLVTAKVDSSTYLAFVENPKESQPAFLSGPVRHRFDERAVITEADPTRIDVNDLVLRKIGYPFGIAGNFEINDALFLAIQCEARGWHGLATQILDEALAGNIDYTFRGTMYGEVLYNSSDEMSPKAQLCFSAWHYWCSELIQPGTDRAVIARHMELLFEKERMEKARPAGRQLLAALRKTIAPTQAQPGSTEDLIDRITEVNDLWARNSGSDLEYQPHLLRLVEMGFDAVPALIDHLNDQRLTRESGPPVCGGWCPPFIYPVGFFVDWILTDLAGRDAAKPWVDARTQEEKGPLIHDWWKRVKETGEEAYFMNHVLPTDKKAGSPSYAILDAIAKKYPQNLPVIYSRILNDRVEIESRRVIRRLARSSLPLDQKLESLVLGARKKDWRHRLDALEMLRELDPKQFTDLLSAALDEIQSAKIAPDTGVPGLSTAHLIWLMQDDPKAWETLERVCRQSEVGLRMEFLGNINSGCGCDVTDRIFHLRLKFLRDFLDDDSAMDTEFNKEMFKRLYAGDAALPLLLSVQNFAALQLMKFLTLPDRPGAGWTDKQWAMFREKAQLRAEAALKR